MKQKRYIAWSVLLAPAILAFSARGQVVRFQPAKGTVLTKSIETNEELSLEDMSMVMNGQELDPSMVGMEMTTTTQRRVVVTDEYASLDGGRTQRLRRTFDELNFSTSTSMSNQMMGDMDSQVDGESELEGLTVVFEWDADSEEYTVEFDEDSDGDEDLLEDLTQEIDLLGFLPEDEVAEGDSWELEPEIFRSILAPGGSLKIEPDESSVQDMPMGSNRMPSPDKALGEFGGEATAEFVDVREVDGVRVALIRIEFEISTASDLTELMQEMMADAPLPDGMEIEMEVESFDMEIVYEGEGELLWNLEGGHLHSFEISGEKTQTVDNSMSVSMAGQAMAMEQSMTMAGTTTIKITTSVNS